MPAVTPALRAVAKPAFLLMLACAAAACGSGRTLNADPEAAQIFTADIPRFWASFDRLATAASRADSVRAFDEGYLRPASPGLRAFARLRIGDAGALVDAVGAHPAYYRGVRAGTVRAGEAAPAIRQAMRKLQQLYPPARFPDVYLVIGRMTSAGTASDVGLYVGVEMLARSEVTPTAELSAGDLAATSGAADIPCVVAHELVHYQQPAVRERSLLAQSLYEGVADVVGELAAGCRGTTPEAREWAAGREAEVWAAFRSEMHGRDLSQWLYNQPTVDGRPADLGYWMGYEIVRSYYDQAEDKGAAIQAVLSIRDPDAFLAASGYDPSRPTR